MATAKLQSVFKRAGPSPAPASVEEKLPFKIHLPQVSKFLLGLRKGIETDWRGRGGTQTKPSVLTRSG